MNSSDEKSLDNFDVNLAKNLFKQKNSSSETSEIKENWIIQILNSLQEI